ncbi:helix-turn-helix transcriptional regulator [Pseudonocardia terrae]|uniref:helix-turn-helix transcriptional regulator n=1 Tax=Pseudonocardia terrae TaxID=2905831 RepID=UPI0027E17C75|nr:AAA family ATPase [Pseudonocardia terrae]
MTAPARPPLIGRTDELRSLAELFEAARAGTPGVALVSGEAGVGKSRLVAELVDRAGRAGAVVLAGAAVDVGESPPLLPLTLAVRTLAREPAGRAIVEPWRGELEALGLLPPAPGAAVQAVPHHLDAAGRVLLGLAADRPVLFVVEDVQWADRATRDLLAYLTAIMLDARLLVVVTHREGGGSPGLDELGLGGLRRHPRVRGLSLGPLDRGAIAELVARAPLPDTDVEDPVELVWQRSRGNAFIAEETVRALRDRDPMAVSGTLRDLVLGRVRALPEDARTVVRALSVAEGAVSHELAQLVTGLPPDRLLTAVRHVVEEGSVVLDGPGAEGGDDGYRLRHGLAVDVVSADLLPAERRDLHRRYAAALAELTAGGDRSAVAALLAHHWDRAGDDARALTAAADAASAAERVHGYADAYRHWRRVADLVAGRTSTPARPAPEPVVSVGLDRPASLERAAEAAHLAGEHDAAVSVLQERIGLTAPADPQRATLVARLGDYLLAAGRGVEAEGAYREALRLGGEAHVALLAGHAEALQAAGRFADARDEATRALEAARHAGTLDEQARVLVTLGFSLAYLEDTQAGAAALAEGLRVAEASGSPAVLGSAYHRRAELLSGPLNALSEGIDLALAGAERLTELGLGRTHGVRLLALAANGQFRCGRWDEAVEVIDQAFRARPSGSEALDIRLSRGRMRVGRGDLSGAAEDLDAVAMLAHDTVGARYRVPLLTLRAGLDMFLGRPEQAVGHTVAGLDALETGHDDVWLEAPLIWHGLRAHAETVRLDRPPPAGEVVHRLRESGTGLHDRARRAVPMVGGLVRVFAQMCDAEVTRADGDSDPELWGEVAAQWRRRDQPYNVAYGQLRRAEALLARRTRSKAAAEALAEAHHIATQLGARPFLEEVRDLGRRARIRLPDLVVEPERAAVPAVPAPVPGSEDARPAAPRVAASRPSRRDVLASLTPRETEVLAEIAAGHTNREIAQRLFISEKTVGIHVTHLLAKLGVRSRVQAGAVYLRAAPTEPHPTP